MNRPAPKTFHDQVTDPNLSALKRYQQLVIGNESLWALIKYELITLLLCNLPGALGLVLRKRFYPMLLGKVGRNVLFGKGVTIRHGEKVSLGDNVIIDDYVVLDGKGKFIQEDTVDDFIGIVIGNDSIISRNCVLSCKGANILIGEHCALGISNLIHSVEGSDCNIGDHVITGAFTYFISGGNYHSDELDIPFKQQGQYAEGGITIEENVWIGSHAQLMDGVTVGTGAIIGAGAVVNKNVPAYDIAAGVPAKKIRSRKPTR